MMPSMAMHMRFAPQDVEQAVEHLFKAAFGPSPAKFRQQSLCGWRPLAALSALHPPLADLLKRKNTGKPGKDAVVEIYETAKAFIIEVTLTGIIKESLYLEITGNLLIIHGERMQSNTAALLDNIDSHFQQIVQLPKSARPGEIRARMKGDTVKINIQKLAW
jgi:HSP20 family molecular chaperone IbpA